MDEVKCRKIEHFNELFESCINENGEVLPCGRQMCIRLIHFAKRNFPDGEVVYGDESTGYMNVEKLISLHSKLNPTN